eukprot:scaffold253204_cov17-Prasinocladus_malaysianus.AAC.1
MYSNGRGMDIVLDIASWNGFFAGRLSQDSQLSECCIFLSIKPKYQIRCTAVTTKHLIHHHCQGSFTTKGYPCN